MTVVLHLITTLEVGGAQTMLRNVVDPTHSSSRFRHIVVDMMDGGSMANSIRACGVPVHSLGMKRGRISPAAVYRFLTVLRREKPAIVQTWLYHADLLGLSALAFSEAQLVWNIRCAWHLGLHRTTPRLCARSSSLPAAVVVNSEAGRRVHESIGYHPKRWCLIGNGFDLDLFRPDEGARASLRVELGLDTRAMLVGLIGRWDPHKDHATFLAGAALLKAKHPDVHFVLAGEGVSNNNLALHGLVTGAGLSDCVHLLGRRSDVARVTAALDLATCTSIGEAFPNIVGEAMSAATPCVVTDVGDAAALVDDPALVVPPRNAEKLAAAWARLISMDIGSRRDLGLKARARIIEHFSLPVITKRYETLYDELLAG